MSIGNGIDITKKISICKKKWIDSNSSYSLIANVFKYVSLVDNLLIKRRVKVGPNALVCDGVFIDNCAIISHNC